MRDKLLNIQKKCLSAIRDTKAYNYKYATLEQVWGTLQPILQEEGLVVVHKTENREVCTGVLATDSDEELWSCLPLPENIDPQKIGSAVTYYRRYNLLQLFNIMVEDDDAQSLSGKGNGVTNQTKAPTL